MPGDMRRPNVKKRKLRDDLMAACTAVANRQSAAKGAPSEAVMEMADKMVKVLDDNNPITEGNYTSPISNWIMHSDIDENWITISNVSGGTLTVSFQERIDRTWEDVNPDGQSTDNSLSDNRIVDHDIYDGDHRLKISCASNVSYHLKFESKDN